MVRILTGQAGRLRYSDSGVFRVLCQPRPAR